MGLSAQEVQDILPEAVKIAPFDIDMKDGKEISKSGENYITVAQGGTGLTTINTNSLLVGNGINSIITSNNLSWNNSTNTLSATN